MDRLILIATLWTFIISATMLFGGSFVLSLCLAAGIHLAIQLFA